LIARDDLAAPALAELAALDEAAFRARFAGGPIKRLGHTRFLRNVLIAIGNSGNRTLAASARRRLAHSSPLVRAMAVWALGRLAEPEVFAALAHRLGAEETDPAVMAEWRAPVI
jgi:epoxyqueuosine reductase